MKKLFIILAIVTLPVLAFAFPPVAPVPSGTSAILSTGTDTTPRAWPADVLSSELGAGSGDVSSSSTITNDAIVRGDGGAKGVQESLVTISDTGVIAINGEFTLPNTDGGAGEALVTDGSGAVAFTDVWTESENTSAAYYAAGDAVAVKTANTDPADSSGEYTITETECQRGVVTDGDLGEATDATLPDLQYYTDFQIFIENGSYAISLVAPSGEKLYLFGTGLLDANDEIDLSDDEFDLFSLKRVYSDSETEWVWMVIPVIGTATDGGAAD